MVSERKSEEWASSLSDKLQDWLPKHGYRTTTKLADELGIPKANFGRICRGEAIAEGPGHGREKYDGRVWYAKIHLWTQLPEADPKSIPDKLIKTPQGVLAAPIPRRWSEEEHQRWLESPEAEELLAKKNARFKREMVMESVAAPQQAESSETVGSFIGAFIDDLINRGADQIAHKLLERQKDAVLPGISDLENKITSLESAIARLVVLSQTDQTSSPKPRGPRTSDIGQLANHLKNLLDGYRLGTREDRNKLMQRYGTDLMSLDIVVHTLTRRPNEREEILNLTEETKL